MIELVFNATWDVLREEQIGKRHLKMGKMFQGKYQEF